MQRNKGPVLTLGSLLHSSSGLCSSRSSACNSSCSSFYRDAWPTCHCSVNSQCIPSSDASVAWNRPSMASIVCSRSSWRAPICFSTSRCCFMSNFPCCCCSSLFLFPSKLFLVLLLQFHRAHAWVSPAASPAPAVWQTLLWTFRHHTPDTNCSIGPSFQLHWCRDSSFTMPALALSYTQKAGSVELCPSDRGYKRHFIVWY